MLWPEQLRLFEPCSRSALSGRLFSEQHGDRAPWLQNGRDTALEIKARELLRGVGAERIAALIQVKWNSRLRSCAGRAIFREKLVSLNPRLREHTAAEIDRTLRHELAHLLAQYRAGRRRVLPHGPEWRVACHDLGIGDEKRCHNLPFPVKPRARHFIYKCPSCSLNFPRVRAIRRVVACLACCRKHNRGKFTPKFRLQLLKMNALTQALARIA
jgi:SprT protein